MAKDLTINDRVNRLEWTTEKLEGDLDKRLSAGAETFSNIRDSVEKLSDSVATLNKEVDKVKAPKPFPWMRFAAFSFSVLALIGTMIWGMAKYPDGEDFKEANDKSSAAAKELDTEMTRVGTEQRLIKVKQEAHERSLKKIDKKIDLLLLTPRERKEAMAPDR